MFISILECLNQTQSLVHATTNRQVVHGDLTQSALVVDDEESTQGVTVILQVNSIVLI